MQYEGHEGRTITRETRWDFRVISSSFVLFVSFVVGWIFKTGYRLKS